MTETAEIVPARSLSVGQWSDLLIGNGDAWISHCRTWCLRVDARHGATDSSLAVVNRDGTVRALVPLVSIGTSQPVLVSGISEPSGPLFDHRLSAAERGNAWQTIDRAVRDVAPAARGVVFKLPVLGSSGARIRHQDKVALAALGYHTECRSFFHMELDCERGESWERVSPRVRTQIRRASRECRIVAVNSIDDLRMLTEVYASHAATKGQQPPMTAEDLAALEADEQESGFRTMAVLGYAGEELLGFALAFGVGVAATLFAWGSINSGPSRQLSKFLVWESLMALKDKGFSSVEYGGDIPDQPSFSGLTEFYRRLGGSRLETVWAHKTY
jgi:hypothetical protein